MAEPVTGMRSSATGIAGVIRGRRQPSPDPDVRVADVMAEIGRAVVALDRTALLGIKARERYGPGRPLLLRQAVHALGLVDAALASPEGQARRALWVRLRTPGNGIESVE